MQEDIKRQFKKFVLSEILKLNMYLDQGVRLAFQVQKGKK